MGVSNSSSIQVRRVREVTQGVLPASAMGIIPFETWKLSGPITRETPGNVRADRQTVDNPASDIKVSGTATSDFTYGDYDPLIEEVFCGALGTPFTITATTIAAVVSGNKLTGASGAWTGLVDGDAVLVSGFATNPALFLARVKGTPTSTDLPLDPDFITVAAESAGPSVTVYHSGRFRPGTSTLTSYWEEWNTVGLVGKQSGGVICKDLQVDVPQPNKCKLSFQFEGLTNAKISAQLANSSTQPSGNPLINSNINFGDKLNPAVGLGFRYGKVGGSGVALMPTLRVKKWMLTISSPVLPEGGAGVLGPVDVSLDGLITIKLALTFLRNSAAAETLIGDAEDSTTTASFGVGFRDGNGHRQYIWLPAMQPHNENTDGLKQKGREQGSVEYMAKIDTSASPMMAQWTKFN